MPKERCQPGDPTRVRMTPCFYSGSQQGLLFRAISRRNTTLLSSFGCLFSMVSFPSCFFVKASQGLSFFGFPTLDGRCTLCKP